MKARSWTVAGLVLVLALTGCSATDGSNPAGDPLPSGAATSSAGTRTGSTSGASNADIRAAGLQPCPPSDLSAEAVAGGLPAVTLPCLGEGPDVNLAGLRGKPMVVNVWQSYCEPCLAELPLLGDFARRAGDRVRFVGIDLADERVAGLLMAGQTRMYFPSVQDPDSEVRAGLRLVGLPTTLFVRPDGVIAGRSSGEITDAAQLSRLIEQYLDVRV